MDGDPIFIHDVKGRVGPGQAGSALQVTFPSTLIRAVVSEERPFFRGWLAWVPFSVFWERGKSTVAASRMIFIYCVHLY